MDRSEIKAAARAQIKGNIGILLVIYLLTILIMYTFIGTIVMPAIALSTSAIFINMTRDQKPKVGDMFCRFELLGRGWLLQLMMGFFVWLWSLLFIVPGIIKMYSYSMAVYLMADDPSLTAREAINISKELTEGHKWELFMLDLSFIGWGMLSAVTLGLAAIYAVPYMSAARATFYAQLRGEEVKTIA